MLSLRADGPVYTTLSAAVVTCNTNFKVCLRLIIVDIKIGIAQFPDADKEVPTNMV